MTELDRTLQHRLLEHLAAEYPNWCQPSDLGFDADDAHWHVNVLYLDEHQLVQAKTSTFLGSPGPQAHLVKATARGLDFLRDDGGLSAILNVVSVRFEADTLKALIGAHVDASALPTEEKSRIKAVLQSAGAEALKETTKRLVQLALDHAPQALQLLQTLRG